MWHAWGWGEVLQGFGSEENIKMDLRDSAGSRWSLMARFVNTIMNFRIP
jgi:hypothetical protein